MDQQRFDDLTRKLSRLPSRRAFLKAVAGAATAALAGRTAAEAQPDKKLWKQKCKTHSDCPAGAACVNNHCACPPGTTLCHADSIFAGCVDLQTDHDNCGACGIGCSINMECIDGACRCPEPLDDCGEGGCTDIASDPLNCGARSEER